mmetsp:Transcript_156851/g.292698  ORF Transcript_156851/g.292698 Transcript_156851/m.292698 type:complete len:244 (+) Transcript_156851:106-837(+)
MEHGPSEIDEDVYKVVALVDGRLLSIFDATTEYTIGVRIDQLVLPGHGGGFYVSRTPEEALRAVFTLPRRSRLLLAPRVLLRCRAQGMCLSYGSGKLAVSSLMPLEAKPVHGDVPATYAGRCRRQASISRGRSNSAGPRRRPSTGERRSDQIDTPTRPPRAASPLRGDPASQQPGESSRLEWPVRSTRLPRPTSARPEVRPRFEPAARASSRPPSPAPAGGWPAAAGQPSGSRGPFLQVVAAR